MTATTRRTCCNTSETQTAHSAMSVGMWTTRMIFCSPVPSMRLKGKFFVAPFVLGSQCPDSCKKVNLCSHLQPRSGRLIQATLCPSPSRLKSCAAAEPRTHGVTDSWRDHVGIKGMTVCWHSSWQHDALMTARSLSWAHPSVGNFKWLLKHTCLQKEIGEEWNIQNTAGVVCHKVVRAYGNGWLNETFIGDS